MTLIKIDELGSGGIDLIADQESYLDEITDDEFSLITGGSTPLCSAVSVIESAVAVSKAAVLSAAVSAGAVLAIKSFFGDDD